jgi:hypothetical protein
VVAADVSAQLVVSATGTLVYLPAAGVPVVEPEALTAVTEAG